MSEYKIEKGLFIFFSLLTILLVLLKAWPFVIVTYLFPLYYLIKIKFDKKLSAEINVAIGVFFIILVYVFIRYFYIVANKSLWYYPYLAQTSELINSDFINLVIIGLYVIFTFAMFNEMKKARILESKYKDLISEPKLNASINYMDGFFIRIKNLSKGPALKVEVKMQTNPAKDDTYKSVWKYDLIDAEEYYDLIAPHVHGDIKKFVEGHDSIDVDIKYFNISEKECYRKFKLNLKDITLFKYQNVVLKRGPLNEISDTLKEISRPFSAFGIKLYRDHLEETEKFINQLKKDKQKKLRTPKKKVRLKR